MAKGCDDSSKQKSLRGKFFCLSICNQFCRVNKFNTTRKQANFPNTIIAELNVKRFGNINNHARFELFPSFIPTIFFKYLWVYSIAMFQHLSSICHTQTILYLSLHFVITILTVTMYRIINCLTINDNYHVHQHHSIVTPLMFFCLTYSRTNINMKKNF